MPDKLQVWASNDGAMLEASEEAATIRIEAPEADGRTTVLGQRLEAARKAGQLLVWAGDEPVKDLLRSRNSITGSFAFRQVRPSLVNVSSESVTHIGAPAVAARVSVLCGKSFGLKPTKLVPAGLVGSRIKTMTKAASVVSHAFGMQAGCTVKVEYTEGDATIAESLPPEHRTRQQRVDVLVVNGPCHSVQMQLAGTDTSAMDNVGQTMIRVQLQAEDAMSNPLTFRLPANQAVRPDAQSTLSVCLAPCCGKRCSACRTGVCNQRCACLIFSRWWLILCRGKVNTQPYPSPATHPSASRCPTKPTLSL